MSWSIEPTFAQCNARATAAHRCTICVESESFHCLTDDIDIPLCFIYIYDAKQLMTLEIPANTRMLGQNVRAGQTSMVVLA
jgi:hypothetical protein